MADPQAHPPVIGPNPYVGPNSFTAQNADHFFGRRDEVRQLADLVVAHRVVLFYAQSGAGKTSLLRAGLIPHLQEKRRVDVLPVVRVAGQERSDPALGVGTGGNIFVFNLLSDLYGQAEQPGDVAGLSLQEGLAPFLIPEPDERRPRPRLLIIDQFEEFFTTHGDRPRDRSDFFRQLQETLAAAPRLTLLLSMREDYIANLDFYTAQMPDRLRTRFRMERLAASGALEAIVEPARLAGRRFEPGVAEALVDNLRQVQTRRLGEAVPGRGRPTGIGRLRGASASPDRLPGIVGTTARRPRHDPVCGCGDLWRCGPSPGPILRTGRGQGRGRDRRQSSPVAGLVWRKADHPGPYPRPALSGRADHGGHAQPGGQRVAQRLHCAGRGAGRRSLLRIGPRPVGRTDPDRQSALPRTAISTPWPVWRTVGPPPDAAADLLLGRAELTAAQRFARTHAADLLPVESEFLAASLRRRTQRRWMGVIAATVFAVFLAVVRLCHHHNHSGQSGRTRTRKTASHRRLPHVGGPGSSGHRRVAKERRGPNWPSKLGASASTAEAFAAIRQALNADVQLVHVMDGDHGRPIMVTGWSAAPRPDCRRGSGRLSLALGSDHGPATLVHPGPYGHHQISGLATG